MPDLMAAVYAVAAVAILGSFVMFDLVVKLERDEYPEQWALDGQPTGFFDFTPPIDGMMQSGRSAIARFTLAFEWLFYTPDWALDSDTARRLLVWFRIGVAISNVIWVATLVQG